MIEFDRSWSAWRPFCGARPARCRRLPRTSEHAVVRLRKCYAPHCVQDSQGLLEGLSAAARRSMDIGRTEGLRCEAGRRVDHGMERWPAENFNK